MEKGKTMTRRGLAVGRQIATFAALAVLALSLSGDRTSAAGVPATVYGQDPLEVLELKVRPNVIVVLDSSGSMQWLVDENDYAQSGDHPRSKLYQAKQVLKQAVQNNQDKVSFQMGTYTQYGMSFVDRAVGRNRFQYVVSGTDAPFMNTATTELTAKRAVGDGTTNRGLQSWQIIDTKWGTLYFDEDGNGTGTVDSQCTAALTGLPRFFATGAALATALQTAMNTSATCTSGKNNTYAVTYTAASGVFGFKCSTCSRYWRLAWDRTPNNIRNSLAETTPTATAFTNSSATTRSTDAPWILLYRTSGTGSANSLSAPFADGMDTRWSFSETIDGTSVNFYHVATSRLWNGEVIRVNTATGEVCGMDFATAATKTNPPSVTLQAADASCNPGTNRAVFKYAGIQEASNSRSCAGFRSKSQLIPCDLQAPPAPMQFTTISPYLDTEVPFASNGDPKDWDGDGYADYWDKEDGSWEGGRMTSTGWTNSVNLAPSANASGSTPLANSLIDIKGTANNTDTTCVTTAEAIYPGLDLNSIAGTTGACVERGFTKLWNTGLSTGPWAGIPAAQRAIKNHQDPKEKTIVLFVTDGNDTCGTRTGTTGYTSFTGADDQERMSRRAAYFAEELYRRIDALQAASSVQTYVIGYGGAFPAADPYLLNLIAWGGSGLGQGLAGQPDVNWLTDSEATLSSRRTPPPSPRSSRRSSTRAPRKATSTPSSRSRSRCSSTWTSSPARTPAARRRATRRSSRCDSSRASPSPGSRVSSGPTRTTAPATPWRCGARAPSSGSSWLSATRTGRRAPSLPRACASARARPWGEPSTSACSPSCRAGPTPSSGASTPPPGTGSTPTTPRRSWRARRSTGSPCGRPRAASCQRTTRAPASSTPRWGCRRTPRRPTRRTCPPTTATARRPTSAGSTPFSATTRPASAATCPAPARART
jgi:hypothetical protein